MPSHVLQAVCDSAGADPSVGLVEAAVASMLLPTNVVPDASSLDVVVVLQLSALTAANVATFSLRTGGVAGPVVLAFTVNAAGVIVAATGTMAAPSALESLYLTGRITTGSGTASVAAASVLLKAIPPVVMPSLPRRRGSTRGSEFGRDVDAVYDITPRFTVVDGLANLGRALARRLSTPRGGLFYDPDYGLDLTEYLGADVAGPEMASLAPLIAGECEKDPRVQSVNVGIEYAPQLQHMRITIRGETAEGPFDLVLDASASGISVAAIGFRG